MIGTAKKKGKKSEDEPTNLLKTHIEKMSLFCLSKMFMRTNDLFVALQDVIENKGGY